MNCPQCKSDQVSPVVCTVCNGKCVDEHDYVCLACMGLGKFPEFMRCDDCDHSGYVVDFNPATVAQPVKEELDRLLSQYAALLLKQDSVAVLLRQQRQKIFDCLVTAGLTHFDGHAAHVIRRRQTDLRDTLIAISVKA